MAATGLAGGSSLLLPTMREIWLWMASTAWADPRRVRGCRELDVAVSLLFFFKRGMEFTSTASPEATREEIRTKQGRVRLVVHTSIISCAEVRSRRSSPVTGV